MCTCLPPFVGNATCLNALHAWSIGLLSTKKFLLCDLCTSRTYFHSWLHYRSCRWHSGFPTELLLFSFKNRPLVFHRICGSCLARCCACAPHLQACSVRTKYAMVHSYLLDKQSKLQSCKRQICIKLRQHVRYWHPWLQDRLPHDATHWVDSQNT